jgi:hypothetical protein
MLCAEAEGMPERAAGLPEDDTRADITAAGESGSVRFLHVARRRDNHAPSPNIDQ